MPQDLWPATLTTNKLPIRKAGGNLTFVHRGCIVLIGSVQFTLEKKDCKLKTFYLYK